MATGESLAHLNHLVALGDAMREIGTDGVARYRLARQGLPVHAG
jgi:hypothetical protein